MAKTVSVQLYSIRDAIADDLDRAVARVAELGLTCVEPFAFVKRARDYQRALAATGLLAPSAHASVIAAADPASIFTTAAEIGVGTVIDPFVPPKRWQTGDGVARLADRVNRLAAQAADAGVAFGYHNHPWEVANQVDGRSLLESFASRLDPRVVLEVDTYWVAAGGADTPALLKALGSRVHFMHVRDGIIPADFLGRRRRIRAHVNVKRLLSRAVENELPLGEGGIDIPPILAAAPDAVRVIEFDGYAGDVFAGIETSKQWLDAHDS